MKKKKRTEKKMKKAKAPKNLITFPPFVDTGSITQISTKLTSIEYQRLCHLKREFDCSGQAIVSLALNYFYGYLTNPKQNL
ncbi:hypothetical protein QDS52_17385 [Acinetobacter baumannii]|uniref:hypothetical protein n=1 Tax=Acinetobacter baumannii TaxID=470 RepID=UPI00244C8E02|nr:hypothetical protein [Acinetobacter baumannii]MDH2510767.1 hypothetical protein [Acinetobacter baumannii]